MRDKRTPKDVCGEASVSLNGGRGLKQRKYSNALINLQALAKTIFSKASTHD